MVTFAFQMNFVKVNFILKNNDYFLSSFFFCSKILQEEKKLNRCHIYNKLKKNPCRCFVRCLFNAHQPSVPPKFRDKPSNRVYITICWLREFNNNMLCYVIISIRSAVLIIATVTKTQCFLCKMNILSHKKPTN